jgi:hypothetical protein
MISDPVKPRIVPAVRAPGQPGNGQHGRFTFRFSVYRHDTEQLMKKILFILSMVISGFLATGSQAQFAYGYNSGVGPLLFRFTTAGFFTPISGSLIGSPLHFFSIASATKKPFIYEMTPGFTLDTPEQSDYIMAYRVSSDGIPSLAGQITSFLPPTHPYGYETFSNIEFISGNGKYVVVLNQDYYEDMDLPPNITLSLLTIQNDGSVSYNPEDEYPFVPYYATQDPAGKFIYGSGVDGETYGYRVEAGGSLSAIPSVPPPDYSGFCYFPSNTSGVNPQGNYYYEFYLYTDSEGGPIDVPKLAVYAIANDGSLREVPDSPFFLPDEIQPYGITSFSFTPNGSYLYALGVSGNYNQENLYCYRIDRTTGKLFPLPGSPIILSNQPSYSTLAVDPAGKFLMVQDGRILLIQPDGTLTERSGSPSGTIPYIEGFIGKE